MSRVVAELIEPMNRDSLGFVVYCNTANEVVLNDVFVNEDDAEAAIIVMEGSRK